MDEHAKRVPYEMRHTYASLVSDSGITAEGVAQQLGHNRRARSSWCTGLSSSLAAGLGSTSRARSSGEQAESVADISQLADGHPRLKSRRG